MCISVRKSARARDIQGSFGGGEDLSHRSGIEADDHAAVCLDALHPARAALAQQHHPVSLHSHPGPGRFRRMLCAFEVRVLADDAGMTEYAPTTLLFVQESQAETKWAESDVLLCRAGMSLNATSGYEAA